MHTSILGCYKVGTSIGDATRLGTSVVCLHVQMDGMSVQRWSSKCVWLVLVVGGCNMKTCVGDKPRLG